MPQNGWIERLLPRDEGPPMVENHRSQLVIQCNIYGFTWIGWICALVSVFRCSFIKTGIGNLDYRSLDARGLFGAAFYTEEHELLGCLSYTSEMDSFKMSRSFGVLLILSMTAAVILSNMLLFISDVARRRLIVMCLRTIFPFSFVCNALLFTVFANAECNFNLDKCVPGMAGIVAIVNGVVLLTLSTLVFLVPAPKDPVFLPVWKVQEIEKDIKRLTRMSKSARTLSTRRQVSFGDMDPMEVPSGDERPLPAVVEAKKKKKQKKVTHARSPQRKERRRRAPEPLTSSPQDETSVTESISLGPHSVKKVVRHPDGSTTILFQHSDSV